MNMLNQDQRNLIRKAIFPIPSLVRAIFSGSRNGEVIPWIKILIRPVQIKGDVFLQISYFDKTKNITKNFNNIEAQDKLEELLDIPFKNIRIETIATTLNLQFTKKDKMIVHNERSSVIPSTTSLNHDIEKQKILSEESAIPYLKAIGILTKDGKIIANMQRKYSQINEFLRTFSEIDISREFIKKQVHVVDFGCGNAYLTFATYYYLTYVLKLEAYVVGIDIKKDLLENHRRIANELGWTGLTFVEGQISNYHPDQSPEIVIALHACDTATDDAIAHGIRANSRLIVTAPCCQHFLQEELSKIPMPKPILAVGRDGILRERLGDILTDTFRATILRIFGYHTDVIQFVSTEHTAKNLLIRAFRTKKYSFPNLSAHEEYNILKSFWGVTPYLEHLVTNELDQLFANRIV